MSNLPKNRYKSEELLALFDQAEVQNLDGDFYKTIEANGEEIEIYFPTNEGNVQNSSIERARRLLTNIQELDNQVQDSCEAEYKKSSFHIENFMLYLAAIEVKEDGASFRYYGERVNTEWDAVFRENDQGIWERVNF